MALTSFFRRSGLQLAAVGLVFGCSKQPEPETPPQPYQQQPGVYPQQQYPGTQQPGQYPQQQPGQYPQQQPGQYPQQQYPAPTGYPPATTPGATPPTGTPPATGMPPVGGALPTDPGAPQATPLDPSAAAAVQPILAQLASSKATAGAKPIGSVMAANFQQGQALEAQVQMEPGKCYTVVGAGVPPVTELDLKLVAVTPMPGMAPVLAVDNSSGMQAVLGEKPNCFKWAWPIPAPVKVVVTVTAGSGLAAAQLFGK